MLPVPALLTFGCLISVAGLLVAEQRGHRAAKRLFKIAASTAFVFIAVLLPAQASTYAQLVLVALVLSWFGDVCLLSERSAWFLSGLGLFLLAHIVFGAAFASAGLNHVALLAALAPLSAAGALTLRWLWPRLDGAHKAAVSGYVLAIVIMCALAIAYSVAARSILVAVAALAFASSDVAVARDRFVARGFSDKVWGLPVYYVAQLLFAWSVAV